MEDKGALILTESQWKNILKWIPNNEREQQEEEILKYLKEASEEMKAKWPENNRSKHEAKREKRVLNAEMERFEAIKNATPDERKRMIEEAEKFVSVRKIKECPIELRSAAILSENLYGRKLQLDFQAAHKKEEKEKTEIRNKMDMAQSVAWLNDGWQHRTNAFAIAKQHKAQLLDMINDRKAKRDSKRAHRIELEKKMIEEHFQKGREQVELEKRKKQEMHEYMRKHELQTNIMAQQKRDRLKLENQVIDVLVKTHNEGKSKIKEMIKEQEKQTKIERIKLGMKLQQMALERHIVEAEQLENEQKMIEKARAEKEKILDAREEKEKERKVFLKTERLDDYNKSLKAAEERRAIKKQEDDYYFKMRLMNDEISKEYTKIRKQMKDKKTREILENFKRQAKELREHEKREKEEGMRSFNKAFDDDTSDEKFFDYARDLMDDAQKKNRPIKPILEAIKAYKRRQCLDIKKKTRPHEISNVPIEMEIHRIDSDRGKTKRRLKYERDEKKMANVYRSTKFLDV